MVKRILFSVGLLFSVLFLPYIVSLVVAVIGIFYFELYFEGIILLLVGDLLYGAPLVLFYHMVFVLSFLGATLFLVIEFIKKKLTFYRN